MTALLSFADLTVVAVVSAFICGYVAGRIGLRR